MRSTKEKAELCRALHAGAEPTLSAACWDVGTACLLAHVGVPLIDTTSFGAMATRGLPDAVGLATREFMLGNARLIAAAVDLRVQADLENRRPPTAVVNMSMLIGPAVGARCVGVLAPPAFQAMHGCAPRQYRLPFFCVSAA